MRFRKLYENVSTDALNMLKRIYKARMEQARKDGNRDVAFTWSSALDMLEYAIDGDTQSLGQFDYTNASDELFKEGYGKIRKYYIKAWDSNGNLIFNGSSDNGETLRKRYSKAMYSDDGSIYAAFWNAKIETNLPDEE